MVTLSTAFLPPLEYFALMVKDFDGTAVKCKVEIESQESFLKQTYRNRFYFLGSQGREYLFVPIKHNGATLITDIEIDYSTPWTTKLQRALEAAYRMAPFYDYYAEGLYKILFSGETKLFDLNLRIIKYMVAAFRLPVEITPTKEFTKELEGEDYRYCLTPKSPNTILRDLGLGREYFQVFSPRLGFTAGLSALDLLFNEGPAAWEYLMRPHK